MSEEHLETVRRLAAAFNERDLDAFLADVDAEVEFHSLRAQLEGRPYTGYEGVRQMFADFDEDWEYVQIEIGEFRGAGEQAVALVRLRSRGRASRVDLDVPVTFLWRFREGKVIYGKVFSEHADALREAGLE